MTTAQTVEFESLSPSLKLYANRGFPIWCLIKEVRGYGGIFTELTAVDFRSKVGTYVKDCVGSGGYTVIDCYPVEVV